MGVFLPLAAQEVTQQLSNKKSESWDSGLTSSKMTSSNLNILELSSGPRLEPLPVPDPNRQSSRSCNVQSYTPPTVLPVSVLHYLVIRGEAGVTPPLPSLPSPL